MEESFPTTVVLKLCSQKPQGFQVGPESAQAEEVWS